MNVAQNIIKKCGGVSAVADMLSVSTVTVHRWTYPKERGGTGGLVPTKQQGALLEAARAHGIDLRPDDFFPTPTDSEAA